VAVRREVAGHVGSAGRHRYRFGELQGLPATAGLPAEGAGRELGAVSGPQRPCVRARIGRTL